MEDPTQDALSVLDQTVAEPFAQLQSDPQAVGQMNGHGDETGKPQHFGSVLERGEERATRPGLGASGTSRRARNKPKRRSKRTLITIPVIATGHDAAGELFREETRAIQVSRYGGVIVSSCRPAAGSGILIKNPALHRSARGRVVWCAPRSSPKQGFTVGIDFAEPQDGGGIWEVDRPARELGGHVLSCHL